MMMDGPNSGTHEGQDREVYLLVRCPLEWMINQAARSVMLGDVTPKGESSADKYYPTSELS